MTNIGKYLKIVNYSLIGLNFLFWLGVAVYYIFKVEGQEYQIMKIILFIEPICFALIFLGMWKKIKVLFYLSFPFLILNSILSLTDEFGLFDGVALALNFLLFVSLFGYRMRPVEKKEK